MSILRALNLRKSFKKEIIIKGVSLEVSTGEIVGVLGPNGAGKTTTFYMICGLLPPDGGRVELDGEDITPLPLHKRARKGIGYLPQENSIFRDLSVEENLKIIAEYHYRNRKEQERIVELLLEQFNIEPIRERRGGQLSGGERRRVEIARALVPNPRFLFLDEPFAGIDPRNVTEIKGIIRFLKDRGIGVVITDHNVRETLSICDRGYVLRNGEILTNGTPAEIVKNREVRKSYLGEDFQL
ncbi:MAG: LPS export ABC transporter ATP-binding protein [Campylobacterales bacterium]